MRVQVPRGPLDLGSWSNGTTPVRQTGDPGSIPGGSTEDRDVWRVISDESLDVELQSFVLITRRSSLITAEGE